MLGAADVTLFSQRKDVLFLTRWPAQLENVAGNEARVNAMKRWYVYSPESSSCVGDGDSDGLSKSSSLLECEMVCRPFGDKLVIDSDYR